jgi:hypothetical protein
MNKRIGRLTAIAFAALAVSATVAHADVITDGDFEFPPINTFYQNYGAQTNNPWSGATFDNNWSIPTNNVDIVNPMIGWGASAFEGNQILDLVGYGSTGGVAELLHEYRPAISAKLRL